MLYILVTQSLLIRLQFRPLSTEPRPRFELPDLSVSSVETTMSAGKNGDDFRERLILAERGVIFDEEPRLP